MTDLVAIIEVLWKRDFCCMVGRSRVSPNEFECRIFPKFQEMERRFPVILRAASTPAEAIRLALERLGNRKPGDLPHN